MTDLKRAENFTSDMIFTLILCLDLNEKSIWTFINFSVKSGLQVDYPNKRYPLFYSLIDIKNTWIIHFILFIDLNLILGKENDASLSPKNWFWMISVEGVFLKLNQVKKSKVNLNNFFFESSSYTHNFEK